MSWLYALNKQTKKKRYPHHATKAHKGNGASVPFPCDVVSVHLPSLPSHNPKWSHVLQQTLARVRAHNFSL